MAEQAKKVVKSARKHVKNVRKTKKRTARNRREKAFLKGVVKATRTAIANKAADLTDSLKKAISALDKAVQRGIIHANKAARLKSRLTKASNKTK
jgi:small subunit ribosomal protein S20